MRGFDYKNGYVTLKFHYRDKLYIESPFPSCLYEYMSFQEYKQLMYLAYCFLVSLDDYLEEVDDVHVKQRKSKKKSRQKDIQKSS